MPSPPSRRPPPSWRRAVRSGTGCCTKFVGDVVQGGAGTSTNMNANEVVANRALELLGQEFSAYAIVLEEDRNRLAEAVELVHEINLGATAIGTGLNAPAGYAEPVRRHWPGSSSSTPSSRSSCTPSRRASGTWSARPAPDRAVRRRGHRPQPVHRLRGGHRHRQGGPRHWTRSRRTSTGQGPPPRRGATSTDIPLNHS